VLQRDLRELSACATSLYSGTEVLSREDDFSICVTVLTRDRCEERRLRKSVLRAVDLPHYAHSPDGSSSRQIGGELPYVFRNQNARKGYSLPLIRQLNFECQTPGAITPLLHLPPYDANILIGRYPVLCACSVADLFRKL
jgi:hypothetical protein